MATRGDTEDNLTPTIEDLKSSIRGKDTEARLALESDKCSRAPTPAKLKIKMNCISSRQ
jgi:hypothetical protein